MKKLKILSKKWGEKTVLIDNFDFKDISKHNWGVSYNPSIKNFYATTTGVSPKGKRTTVYMHRFIMQPAKGKVIDHINNNSLDNRRKNLRVCAQWQNCFNRGVQRQNSSGYKGVHYYKSRGKYTAYIDIQGKRIRLGYFPNAIDAARKYNEVALEMVGEYARLNKI